MLSNRDETLLATVDLPDAAAPLTRKNTSNHLCVNYLDFSIFFCVFALVCVHHKFDT